MRKYTNDVQCVVEPSRSDPGMWYWAVKIDGEIYADGEADSEEWARHKTILNLNEWKEKNS